MLHRQISALGTRHNSISCILGSTLRNAIYCTLLHTLPSTLSRHSQEWSQGIRLAGKSIHFQVHSWVPSQIHFHICFQKPTAQFHLMAHFQSVYLDDLKCTLKTLTNMKSRCFWVHFWIHSQVCSQLHFTAHSQPAWLYALKHALKHSSMMSLIALNCTQSACMTVCSHEHTVHSQCHGARRYEGTSENIEERYGRCGRNCVTERRRRWKTRRKRRDGGGII